jgi:hypothetical protein
MHSQTHSRQFFINKTEFVYILLSSAYLDEEASPQPFPQSPLHLHRSHGTGLQQPAISVIIMVRSCNTKHPHVHGTYFN